MKGRGQCSERHVKHNSCSSALCHRRTGHSCDCSQESAKRRANQCNLTSSVSSEDDSDSDDASIRYTEQRAVECVNKNKRTNGMISRSHHDNYPRLVFDKCTTVPTSKNVSVDSEGGEYVNLCVKKTSHNDYSPTELCLTKICTGCIHYSDFNVVPIFHDQKLKTLLHATDFSKASGSCNKGQEDGRRIAQISSSQIKQQTKLISANSSSLSDVCCTSCSVQVQKMTEPVVSWRLTNSWARNKRSTYSHTLGNCGKLEQTTASYKCRQESLNQELAAHCSAREECTTNVLPISQSNEQEPRSEIHSTSVSSHGRMICDRMSSVQCSNVRQAEHDSFDVFEKRLQKVVIGYNRVALYNISGHITATNSDQQFGNSTNAHLYFSPPENKEENWTCHSDHGSNENVTTKQQRITFRQCSAARDASQKIPTFTLPGTSSYKICRNQNIREINNGGLTKITNRRLLVSDSPLHEIKKAWKPLVSLRACSSELKTLIKSTIADMQKYTCPPATCTKTIPLDQENQIVTSKYVQPSSQVAVGHLRHDLDVPGATNKLWPLHKIGADVIKLPSKEQSLTKGSCRENPNHMLLCNTGIKSSRIKEMKSSQVNNFITDGIFEIGLTSPSLMPCSYKTLNTLILDKNTPQNRTKRHVICGLSSQSIYSESTTNYNQNIARTRKAQVKDLMNHCLFIPFATVQNRPGHEKTVGHLYPRDKIKDLLSPCYDRQTLFHIAEKTLAPASQTAIQGKDNLLKGTNLCWKIRREVLKANMKEEAGNCDAIIPQKIIKELHTKSPKRTLDRSRENVSTTKATGKTKINKCSDNNMIKYLYKKYGKRLAINDTRVNKIMNIVARRLKHNLVDGRSTVTHGEPKSKQHIHVDDWIKGSSISNVIPAAKQSFPFGGADNLHTHSESDKHHARENQLVRCALPANGPFVQPNDTLQTLTGLTLITHCNVGEHDQGTLINSDNKEWRVRNYTSMSNVPEHENKLKRELSKHIPISTNDSLKIVTRMSSVAREPAFQNCGIPRELKRARMMVAAPCPNVAPHQAKLMPENKANCIVCRSSFKFPSRQCIFITNLRSLSTSDVCFSKPLLKSVSTSIINAPSTSTRCILQDYNMSRESNTRSDSSISREKNSVSQVNKKQFLKEIKKWPWDEKKRKLLQQFLSITKRDLCKKTMRESNSINPRTGKGEKSETLKRQSNKYSRDNKGFHHCLKEASRQRAMRNSEHVNLTTHCAYQDATKIYHFGEGSSSQMLNLPAACQTSCLKNNSSRSTSQTTIALGSQIIVVPLDRSNIETFLATGGAGNSLATHCRSITSLYVAEVIDSTSVSAISSDDLTGESIKTNKMLVRLSSSSVSKEKSNTRDKILNRLTNLTIGDSNYLKPNEKKRVQAKSYGSNLVLVKRSSSITLETLSCTSSKVILQLESLEDIDNHQWHVKSGTVAKRSHKVLIPSSDTLLRSKSCMSLTSSALLETVPLYSMSCQGVNSVSKCSENYQHATTSRWEKGRKPVLISQDSHLKDSCATATDNQAPKVKHKHQFNYGNKQPSTHLCRSPPSIQLDGEQISYMEILPKDGIFKGLRLAEVDDLQFPKKRQVPASDQAKQHKAHKQFIRSIHQHCSDSTFSTELRNLSYQPSSRSCSSPDYKKNFTSAWTNSSKSPVLRQTWGSRLLNTNQPEAKHDRLVSDSTVEDASKWLFSEPDQITGTSEIPTCNKETASCFKGWTTTSPSPVETLKQIDHVSSGLKTKPCNLNMRTKASIYSENHKYQKKWMKKRHCLEQLSPVGNSEILQQSVQPTKLHGGNVHPVFQHDWKVNNVCARTRQSKKVICTDSNCYTVPSTSKIPKHCFQNLTNVRRNTQEIEQQEKLRQATMKLKLMAHISGKAQNITRTPQKLTSDVVNKCVLKEAVRKEAAKGHNKNEYRSSCPFKKAYDSSSTNPSDAKIIARFQQKPSLLFDKHNYAKLGEGIGQQHRKDTKRNASKTRYSHKLASSRVDEDCWKEVSSPDFVGEDNKERGNGDHTELTNKAKGGIVNFRNVVPRKTSVGFRRPQKNTISGKQRLFKAAPSHTDKLPLWPPLGTAANSPMSSNNKYSSDSIVPNSSNVKHNRSSDLIHDTSYKNVEPNHFIKMVPINVHKKISTHLGTAISKKEQTSGGTDVANFSAGSPSRSQTKSRNMNRDVVLSSRARELPGRRRTHNVNRERQKKLLSPVRVSQELKKKTRLLPHSSSRMRQTNNLAEQNMFKNFRNYYFLNNSSPNKNSVTNVSQDLISPELKRMKVKQSLSSDYTEHNLTDQALLEMSPASTNNTMYVTQRRNNCARAGHIHKPTVVITPSVSRPVLRYQNKRVRLRKDQVQMSTNWPQTSGISITDNVHMQSQDKSNIKYCPEPEFSSRHEALNSMIVRCKDGVRKTRTKNVKAQNAGRNPSTKCTLNLKKRPSPLYKKSESRSPRRHKHVKLTGAERERIGLDYINTRLQNVKKRVKFGEQIESQHAFVLTTAEVNKVSMISPQQHRHLLPMCASAVKNLPRNDVRLKPHQRFPADSNDHSSRGNYYPTNCFSMSPNFDIYNNKPEHILSTNNNVASMRPSCCTKHVINRCKRQTGALPLVPRLGSSSQLHNTLGGSYQNKRQVQIAKSNRNQNIRPHIHEPVMLSSGRGRKFSSFRLSDACYCNVAPPSLEDNSSLTGSTTQTTETETPTKIMKPSTSQKLDVTKTGKDEGKVDITNTTSTDDTSISHNTTNDVSASAIFDSSSPFCGFLSRVSQNWKKRPSPQHFLYRNMQELQRKHAATSRRKQNTQCI